MSNYTPSTDPQEKTSTAVAHTALGDIRGVRINGVAAFLGVPYAAPPIGPLRFAATSPVQPWAGELDATQHGPILPQLPPRLNAIMGSVTQRPQGEDCLTLTIRTPAPDTKARPVIVWLHGGAFLSGAGSLDRTDGSCLAREGDLVFVGVNYRLGALGWLHRPGIVEAQPGMCDMIAALSWVQDHITSFGGDPSRVTVMGQSAGANAIARMLMMPEARGLFRRAILQSPALGFGFLSSDRAAELGDQYLCLLGIEPNAPDALQRLCATEVQHLLTAQGELMRMTTRFGRTLPPFMPVVPTVISDTEMLSEIANGTGISGKVDAKDVLIGVTADECHAFFAANPAMEHPPMDSVLERFGGEARLKDYRTRRPGATTMDLLADLETDEIFLLPSMRLAEEIAVHNGNVHAYLFDWAPPESRFRSCHVIEMPFVFGTLDAYRDAPMLAGGSLAEMTDLSIAMRHAWIAFAHNGTPMNEMLPRWPRYDCARRLAMRFGSRIGLFGDLGTLG